MEGKIIVGDIHGNLAQLNNLLSALSLELSEQRRLIFLGDYVNRGNNSKGVLDLLVKLKQKRRLTEFLCGNHDWALKMYLLKNDFDSFAILGGLSTLSSYLGNRISGDVHAAFTKEFPKTHEDFLDGLEVYYEDDDVFCSHTGFAPETPFEHNFRQSVLKAHPQMFHEDFLPQKITVCGHYSQLKGVPFERNNFICLDTISKGWLTALVLPERKFLQVDELGQSRWIH